ncbi:MAG: hypothetical protein PVG07_04180 [Acidobacteriota bacterium]|jgi:hypothetical protein
MASPETEPRAALFCAYAAGVELLRQCFDPEDALTCDDLRDRFQLQSCKDWEWLALHLRDLATVLLPLRFRIVLEGTVHGLEVRLRLHTINRELLVETEERRRAAPPSVALSGRAAIIAYRELGESLGGEGELVELERLVEQIDRLSQTGVRPHLRITVALDGKDTIAGRFAMSGVPASIPKPIVFLFPEAVAAYLASCSLAQLEEECFQRGQRTVFLVFGFDGGFGNDLVAFVGRRWIDRLDVLLTESLAEITLEEGQEVLRLHGAGGVWLERSRWLRPEMFDPGETTDTASGGAAGILVQLRLLRVLLAAIFLADHAEAVRREAGAEDGAEQRVKYRGHVEVAIGISRNELARIDRKASLWAGHDGTLRIDDLYALYRYVYEGYKVDKLEIAQQFVSLLARDLSSLCTKAAEVEGATRQTYHRSLREGIAEYFDARQKIQDRIKSAVDETSGSVLSLTREVSGDLYKLAGLSVGALVGAFLKPDLTPIALLTAGAGIALYAVLVIALHLATLERTYELRLRQHRDFIGSFGEVLRKEEIEAFLGDTLLNQSEILFLGRLGWARLVYGVAFVVALFVVVGALQEIRFS